MRKASVFVLACFYLPNIPVFREWSSKSGTAEGFCGYKHHDDNIVMETKFCKDSLQEGNSAITPEHDLVKQKSFIYQHVEFVTYDRKR